MISPHLLSRYREMMMRNLEGEGYLGIIVGEHNVNNLKYALVIAENKEDLQQSLDIVGEESREKGFELKSKKTEVIVARST